MVEEGTIKKLMASAKCSACGQGYETGNIDVLGHHEDLWFLSVFCLECGAQYLVAAVVSEEKVSEVITDLTGAELDGFRGASGLKVDEMLDMHNFLNDFDGDFLRLFCCK